MLNVKNATGVFSSVVSCWRTDVANTQVDFKFFHKKPNRSDNNRDNIHSLSIGKYHHLKKDRITGLFKSTSELFQIYISLECESMGVV